MSPADEGPAVATGAKHSRARKTSRAHPAAYEVVCTDGGEISVVADGVAATLTSRTYVNDLPIAEAFGDVVPPECADLVDVAVAVYVADRLCPRHPRSAPRSEPLWQRLMHLEVPVREPERWGNGGLGQLLAGVLNDLTDDTWTFTFVARRGTAARPSESQRGLFPEPPPAPASAALFSGGLDSLAGLVAQLAAHPAETVILFCGRTNKRIGTPQRALLNALALEFPHRVRPIAVGFGLTDRRRGAFDREEISQRTRGFVFQAFGAVTARMAGLDRLDVYENGVGAINLAYTDAQLGSQATRATHPATLQRMSALLTQVFSAPFVVALPYAFKTKGELCDALRDAGLGALARRSVSCDGFPQRMARADQCGVCPSCLLRRQSLHHARLHNDDPASLYVHDVYDNFLSGGYERRFSLRAMDGQVHHLRRALASTHPWEAMAARYPELEVAADALGIQTGDSAIRVAIVALYQRYCAEWRAFAASTTDPYAGPSQETPSPETDVSTPERRRVIAPSAISAHARIGRSALDLWQATTAGGSYEQ